VKNKYGTLSSVLSSSVFIHASIIVRFLMNGEDLLYRRFVVLPVLMQKRNKITKYKSIEFVTKKLTVDLKK
jgi:hypothetical protein